MVDVYRDGNMIRSGPPEGKPLDSFPLRGEAKNPMISMPKVRVDGISIPMTSLFFQEYLGNV
jgi:hypothetical protein